MSDDTDTELQTSPNFKRRTGRFSEIVRRSAATSTASFSSNRLTRRTVRQKKGLTELLMPSRTSKASAGAPLNDSELQANVIGNFCTYLERYALGIDGIFSAGIAPLAARNIAQTLNQDESTIDFAAIVEPPELVAAALVHYLESHKRPMVPSKHYDAFVSANAEADDEARSAAIAAAVGKLPKNNLTICVRLFRLFNAIVQNEEFTGLSADAIGGLFGDTLLHNKGSKGNAASGADLCAHMTRNFFSLVLFPSYQREQADDRREYAAGRGLNETEWKLMLTNAKLYKYKRDQEVLVANAPSTSLFLVRRGSFVESIGERCLATLHSGCIFGETALLGSYVAMATVRAADEGAEAWQLDLEFCKQLCAMEPELSVRFWWTIGKRLAARVAAGGDEGDVQGDRELRDIVKERDANAPPPTLHSELVIKDYPASLSSPGHLYIMQHYLSFISPSFLREKKKIIPYDHVSSLSMSDDGREVVLVRKEKNKVVRIEFGNNQDCDEAFALIETMLTHRHTPLSLISPSRTRAVALYPFSSKEKHDLSFNANDIIIVLQKRKDGWWLGERRGVVGYFPSSFVRDDEGLPSVDDWQIIQLGAKKSKYKKQEWLLEPSAPLTHLLQLVSAECTLHNSQKEPIGQLPEGSLYGAEVFFTRTTSDEGVRGVRGGEVRRIEVAWMDKLFEKTPLLAARVVKYLGVCLEMRLRAMVVPPAAAAGDDDDDDDEKKSKKSKKGKEKKETKKGKKAKK